MLVNRVGYFLIAVCCLSCAKRKEAKSKVLFQSVQSDSSGIRFSNNLSFDQHFNIYTYRNFYNGGGVGIGDINNDGLVDIYFTANQAHNKLYLNKGNFKFEDITEKSGVGGTKAWSTGVSMADVNGDGWLDIYVSNSGDVKGDNKENELFINNGDLTFTEKAVEYGVADKGFTTHAVFFDYDKDNDLDLYVLNNSYQAIGSFNLKKNERSTRDALGGDKLMRNDNGHFTDVSSKAGIYGSVIGFGLGTTIGDIDKDGWLDIYVSNDFFERDYLYINQKDGTFKESLTEQMKSISGASMGADLADINNDGWPELFVTEMLPQPNARIKTVTTFEDWNRFQYNLSNDYYYQYTRNTLQLNNGNSTFSEIGRLTGMEATDWSWGALIFDMDNDGSKDVFIANGIYQDLTNQDFLQYASSEEFVKEVVVNKSVDYERLVKIIPSIPQANVAFRNLGGLIFNNQSLEWGLSEPGFSNGSAYADLDNDGDMDLVVNNVNMPAFVYRNETKIEEGHHYLKFILKGEGGNTNAFGTKIEIEANGHQYYIEQMPIRGFESSMDPRPNIGLGKDSIASKVTITWPNGYVTELNHVRVDRILTLDQSDGKPIQTNVVEALAAKIFQPSPVKIDYTHKENDFVDFDRDRLIYHMVSCESPKMSTGDLNQDGLTDLYFGGSKDQPSAMFFQTASGFVKVNEELLATDKISEDMGSAIFDAEGDGDQDIYVCSGGNEFPSSSSALVDRLYINDGKTSFSKSPKLYPTNTFESSSVVRASDYDRDGDQDLFVGIRLQPFNYGMPVNGYILNNDGKGNFSDVSSTVCPQLEKIGMITDAQWADLDNDRDIDLVVVGEWMPLRIFINENGKLSDRTQDYGMEKTTGWWNTIEVADLNGDGFMDLMAGNHGLNSRFRATVAKPVSMYVSDFDRNGSVEQIICTYNGDKSYPLVLRHDLVSQIPNLKKKYLKYENYKDETITDIFTKEQLNGAIQLQASELETSLFINNGLGQFVKKELPIEAQFSPVYAIQVFDFDRDGNQDLLMGGNLYRTKPEVGRYDASYGLFMKGDGQGNFKTVSAKDSGLFIDGEVRDFEIVRIGKSELLIVAKNNEELQVLKIK